MLLTAGCASVGQSGRPIAVEEIVPGLLQGYLATEELPDSLELVPAPPAEASAAFARDKEANWLPAPDGPLYMVMRLYGPEPDALEGKWTPPALQKVK